MSLYKGRLVRHADLPRALACLPPQMLGASFDQSLALWRTWHAQGALQLGWIEALSLQNKNEAEIQCLGVSLWITDRAAHALVQSGRGTAAQRVCEASDRGALEHPWVMDAAQIRSAHASQKLNLLVLHFWTRHPPFDPGFQPVFVQSMAQFRELHQGYGVQQVLQEVSLGEADILIAAGLKLLRADAPDAAAPLALLGLNRKDAHAAPGSALSSLFFSPPSRLDLRPSVQRMLGFALQQLTDDDIAQALACSRDYVRKLWDDAYKKLDQAGVLHATVAADSLTTPRGRERRRLAIEFFRSNPQELRPGLPDQAAHVI